eukprot:gene1703-biopygen12059
MVFLKCWRWLRRPAFWRAPARRPRPRPRRAGILWRFGIGGWGGIAQPSARPAAGQPSLFQRSPKALAAALLRSIRGSWRPVRLRIGARLTAIGPISSSACRIRGLRAVCRTAAFRRTRGGGAARNASLPFLRVVWRRTETRGDLPHSPLQSPMCAIAPRRILSHSVPCREPLVARSRITAWARRGITPLALQAFWLFWNPRRSPVLGQIATVPHSWGPGEYTGNCGMSYKTLRLWTFPIISGAACGGGRAACEQEKSLIGCMYVVVARRPVPQPGLVAAPGRGLAQGGAAAVPLAHRVGDVPRHAHLLRQSCEVQGDAAEPRRLRVVWVVAVERVEDVYVYRAAPCLQRAARRATVFERVELLQLNALRDQRVELWRGNLLGLDFAIPADVRPTHVISQHHHDVDGRVVVYRLSTESRCAASLPSQQPSQPSP